MKQKLKESKNPIPELVPELVDPPYMYLFVRKDMSLEQIVVQSAHAAIRALVDDGRSRRPATLLPLTSQEQIHLIVIGVKNERELIRAIVRTRMGGYEISDFIEPDMDGGEITAAITQPVFGNDRQFFSHYELLTMSGKHARTVAVHARAKRRKR